MNEQLKMSTEEWLLIMEALGKAASRHESEAKFYPARKRIHKKKAVAMREIADKIGATPLD